jgi:hypothetical protein
VIGEVMPIDDAPRAFALADTATAGKIIFRW